MSELRDSNTSAHWEIDTDGTVALAMLRPEYAGHWEPWCVVGRIPNDSDACEAWDYGVQDCSSELWILRTGHGDGSVTYQCEAHTRADSVILHIDPRAALLIARDHDAR